MPCPFKMHMKKVEKAEMRIPLSVPKKPIKPEPTKLRPAGLGDRKSTVMKNEQEPVEKAYSKPGRSIAAVKDSHRGSTVSTQSMRGFLGHRSVKNIKEQERSKFDKAMTAGDSSSTGSKMMHTVADGVDKSIRTQFPTHKNKTGSVRTNQSGTRIHPDTKLVGQAGVEERRVEKGRKKGYTDFDSPHLERRYREGFKAFLNRSEKRTPPDKIQVEKGQFTHLKSRGLVPASAEGRGRFAADQARHREYTKRVTPVLAERRSKDAAAGLKNLTKSMEEIAPVIMKGLDKLSKSLEVAIEKSNG